MDSHPEGCFLPKRGAGRDADGSGSLSSPSLRPLSTSPPPRLPETLGKTEAGKAVLTGTQPNAMRQVPSSPHPSPRHGRSGEGVAGSYLPPFPLPLPLARQIHPPHICRGISTAEGLVSGGNPGRQRGERHFSTLLTAQLRGSKERPAPV